VVCRDPPGRQNGAVEPKESLPKGLVEEEAVKAGPRQGGYIFFFLHQWNHEGKPKRGTKGRRDRKALL
jgi:hypothetical protein